MVDRDHRPIDHHADERDHTVRCRAHLGAHGPGQVDSAVPGTPGQCRVVERRDHLACERQRIGAVDGGAGLRRRAHRAGGGLGGGGDRGDDQRRRQQPAADGGPGPAHECSPMPPAHRVDPAGVHRAAGLLWMTVHRRAPVDERDGGRTGVTPWDGSAVKPVACRISGETCGGGGRGWRRVRWALQPVSPRVSWLTSRAHVPRDPMIQRGRRRGPGLPGPSGREHQAVRHPVGRFNRVCACAPARLTATGRAPE